MKRSIGILFLIAAVAVGTISCGGEDDATIETLSETALDTASQPAETEAMNETPAPQLKSYFDRSEEAGVEAQWPSGCPKRISRTRESIRYPGESAVYEILCERFDDADRGCKIVVYNELTDGAPATPQAVSGTIAEMVGTLGLEIWKQRPIGRGDREGVAAYCRELDGPRHVWIEGFVEGEKALIVMAWDHDESLYGDPGVGMFFSSVRMID